MTDPVTTDRLAGIAARPPWYEPSAAHDEETSLLITAEERDWLVALASVGIQGEDAVESLRAELTKARAKLSALEGLVEKWRELADVGGASYGYRGAKRACASELEAILHPPTPIGSPEKGET
jgi:hypothetical protein